MAKEITIIQEGSNEETLDVLSIENNEALIGLGKENIEKEVEIMQEVSNEETLSLSSEEASENFIDLKKEGSGGTSDYEALLNKPKINGVELSKNKTLDELGIQEKLIAGENVKIENNVISVPTTTDVEEDNTKPITSSAVYTELGNINILLQTI